jgi:8-oxo-dGTP pyrophosphatase MutT (NUDIX family)
MTPVEPRLACTVLLVRERSGLEVLMVERHESQHFASALVFPGGLVDEDDGFEAWDPLSIAHESLSREERAIRIAGFRELHEETGVLLIDADGPPLKEAPHPGEGSFLDLVRKTGARLDLDAMHPFAHWITPVFAPKRYDTHFRLCGLTTELTAISDGSETVSVEWIRPQDAIDLGLAGERIVLFPTRMNLTMLAQSASVEEAIDAATARTIVTVSPRMETRDDGKWLVIPPEAGYGIGEERAGRMP